MRIVRVTPLRGPNVYAHTSVLVMELDLEQLTDQETRTLPGFNERLLQILPGLSDHRCSRRRAGGFIERLTEGTYFAHVVEHVALELSVLAHMDASFGRAIYAGAPGRYWVVMEYTSEKAIAFLLRTAVELVRSVLAGHAYPVRERVGEARQIADKHGLGLSTRAIADAAHERGVPCIDMGSESLVQLGYGMFRRFIRSSVTELTSVIGADIASDRHLTNCILDQASIPVPRGIVVCDEGDLHRSLSDLPFPLVVKPLEANQGQGITIGVTTEGEALEAYRLAASAGEKVVVEEQFIGNDYRVLVVEGRAIAASLRSPAHVIGDGRHTVDELVALRNSDPGRGEGQTREVAFITINEAAEELLRRQGLSRTSIPVSGTRVLLRATASLSMGGSATDVTDLMHPSVARMCERAARLIRLDVCGIDLILPDISREPSRGGGIIEINASPGLRMHLAPSGGSPREVGRAVVDLLFPAGISGRIPIVAITGTNGKTTVTRMTAFILQQTGRTVGMTTTDGIWVGNEVIARGDLTGFKSARSVLSDPSVEVAVLETARGGIMHSGLGYDWSDVGVITNVQEDHIGVDGIESVDDLVHVKALVAERVRTGGTVVLNLDDSRVAAIADRRRVSRQERKIVYFTLEGRSEAVASHISSGGTAFYHVGDQIIEETPSGTTGIAAISAMPITGAGALRFQIANVLAAAAAARALGVRPHQIALALARFTHADNNPGRGDLYRVGKGFVMLDYGHNAHAFASFTPLREERAGRRLTGIITVPGDRADWTIEEAGRTAARAFDRIVIREDEDLRGREPGEIAALLQAAVRRESPDAPCDVIADWRQALARSLEQMEDEELVVLFYEHYAPALEMLLGYQAVPLSSPEEIQRATQGPASMHVPGSATGPRTRR